MKSMFRHPLGWATLAGIALAACVGLGVVLRTAAYYASSDPIAYALVWAIGLGLLGGLAELVLRTRQCVSMYQELDALPPRPDAQSLERVSPALHAWLTARLERAPAPAGGVVFTPYLVGLLVMLGLLGTFLGLFDTLRGARDALTAGGDIEALRAGLAHPMAGLTRSFGSSAAGVSASALLGFAAVFVRRAETKVAARVQAYATGPLQHLSPYQRQHEALIALSEQGRALPVAAEALAGLGERLDAMSARWEQAHAESARGMEQAVSRAVQTARQDLERAASQSAQRLHDLVSPLLSGALERAAEVASARLTALDDRLQADRRAQQEADRTLRALVEREVREVTSQGSQTLETLREAQAGELTALRAEIERRLARLTDTLAEQAQEARVHTQAELSALTDEVRAGADREREAAEQRESQALQHLAALRESAEGFARTLSEQAAAQLDGLRESLGQSVERAQDDALDQLSALREAAEGFTRALGEQGETQARAQQDAAVRISEQLGTAAERFAETIEQVRQRDADQQERSERALAGLEEAAAALSGSLGEHRTQLSELIDGTGTQLTELATAATQGAAQTLEALRVEADAQAQRLASYAQALTDSQAKATSSLQELLEAHATRMTEGVGQAGSTVAEAADLLRASGAELSAVAEMFAASVESQREAANAWLENLGELEGAIEQAGREAAADALGEQLASTQEVFARQLQFQRELFEQLRDMRPDAAPAGHGDDYARA